MSTNLDWPGHFPASCPPEGAESTDGEVYRLVSPDGPKNADFVSHKVLSPHKNWGKKECQACGLSVHTTQNGGERLKRRIPALRKKQSAVARLRPPHGLLLNTPSSADSEHHTWWVPVSLQDPSALFTLVVPRAGAS